MRAQSSLSCGLADSLLDAIDSRIWDWCVARSFSRSLTLDSIVFRERNVMWEEHLWLALISANHLKFLHWVNTLFAFVLCMSWLLALSLRNGRGTISGNIASWKRHVSCTFLLSHRQRYFIERAELALVCFWATCLASHGGDSGGLLMLLELL